ncbi:MAG: ImmA/IrrE family metallo-endopeptidase [Gemmatimonadaceae bacterium]|nr:ImmA/IrrE family metallo-endopeptidase [Gemmatimonadaceae bacterium]
MDELVARSSDGDIEFALHWPAGGSRTSAANATRGSLRVSLRGKAVWYGSDETTGFEWTWIELLEFLAESWLYLAIEDGAPLGVALDTVPRMVAASEMAVESGSPLGSDLEREREQLEAYRLTHDLAEAVQGAAMPPLWIVRDGNTGWAASTTATAKAPFDELLDVLRKVGDCIASRLNGVSDARSREAVRSWHARNSHDRLKVIEAATGYPSELVAEVESIFYSEDERDWTTPRSDELLAAARLVGPQPRTTLRPILGALRRVPLSDQSDLDRASQYALTVIADTHDEPPFMQGYTLASWLRRQPEVVHRGGRVDPEQILVPWNVPLIDASFGLGDIDAIGCWGPSHGPAVLLNSDARHAASSARRRATLAHEICHLLVDRSSSLPLVDVLGGRTARHVEQRARAFAAELLLPREIAGQMLSDHEGNEDRAARSLRSRFGVSSELLAWQAKNSGYRLGSQTRQFLSKLVSNPSEFRW